MTTEQPPSSPADLSPQRHVQYPENPTHNAGLDGFGGASDVDSVVMRRTFLASGTPRTRVSYDGAKRWYVLQNWRQDAAVIISDAGVQRERAFYSPYGRVFGMPAGDLNFDGEFTSAEATTISGWSAGYRAYADINLDGVIDGDDATANTPGALGWDALSRDGSTIGYAGYVQDSSIPTLSHVRHRVYKSDLGRWVQRDPAGYVDGANLYEYAMSSPVVMRDWSGLASQVGGGSGCGLGGVGVDSCGGESSISLAQSRNPFPPHAYPSAAFQCGSKYRERYCHSWALYVIYGRGAASSHTGCAAYGYEAAYKCCMGRRCNRSDAESRCTNEGVRAMAQCRTWPTQQSRQQCLRQCLLSGLQASPGCMIACSICGFTIGWLSGGCIASCLRNQTMSGQRGVLAFRRCYLTCIQSSIRVFLPSCATCSVCLGSIIYVCYLNSP